MNEEQKLAICLLLNLVLALVDHADFSETATKDIKRIAKAFDIEPLDLIKASIS